MGMDIHMYLVHEGKILKNDMFNGRNSDWFRDLIGDGWHDEYDHLPIKSYNVSDQAPEELKKEANEEGFFDHRTVTVGAYANWFWKYRPDKHASWVTTYDKWRFENKNWHPNEDNEKHQLDPEDRIEDWHFIEWDDEYDLGRWLYDEVKDTYSDAEITFWFDW